MPMITPEAIKRKVHGFYRDAIIKWLVGDTTYYPRIIPANLRLDNQITTAITEVELLRSGAKETIGYGYTVHWEQRNSRSFKNNKFPVRLSIDSLDDLLKLTGNQAEFKKLEW